MLLWRMAFRNLGRNRRRTAITVASVAFGVWLAVTFTGAGDYTYTNMLDTGARMGFGHLTIQPEGYQLAPGLDRRIGGVHALRARVLDEPAIDDAVVRITGQAMFAAGAKSVGGGFFAIDPAHETPDRNLFLRALVRGRALTPGDERGILVGEVMAQKLRLRLGRRVVYTAVDVDGEIVSDVAKVRGIFRTGVDDVDGSVAVLHLKAAQNLLRYAPDEATMVSIFLSDHRRAFQLQAHLGATLEAHAHETMTWRQTQAELASVVALDRSMNYLFQLMVGVLIGAGVLNTILMSVLERRRELGIVMALGVTPGQLFGMVVVESLLVGVFGLAAGVIITTPWFLYMNRVGIDLSSFTGGGGVEAGGILVDPVLKMTLFPENAVIIAVAVVAVTVIAGLYPAWQAGRVPPVESIKMV